MTKVRLEISEQEIGDVLTKIWHSSGYDIDKKDPVVIEYMMHKIILQQYEDHLAAALSHFMDGFLPYLNEANAKFESRKIEFTEYAEGKQKEVLASIRETHCKSIDKATTDACQRILDNLQHMLSHLYKQEEELLSRIDQKHTAFQKTAEWFEKRLRWCEYMVGGSAILVSLSLCAYMYLWYC